MPASWLMARAHVATPPCGALWHAPTFAHGQPPTRGGDYDAAAARTSLSTPCASAFASSSSKRSTRWTMPASLLMARANVATPPCGALWHAPTFAHGQPPTRGGDYDAAAARTFFKMPCSSALANSSNRRSTRWTRPASLLMARANVATPPCGAMCSQKPPTRGGDYDAAAARTFFKMPCSSAFANSSNKRRTRCTMPAYWLMARAHVATPPCGALWHALPTIPARLPLRVRQANAARAGRCPRLC